MDLNLLVPDCFGDPDLGFASHPNARGSAFQLLTDCRNSKIEWPNLELAARQYLESRGASEQHKVAELDRMRAAMVPWLEA